MFVTFVVRWLSVQNWKKFPDYKMFTKWILSFSRIIIELITQARMIDAYGRQMPDQ